MNTVTLALIRTGRGQRYWELVAYTGRITATRPNSNAADNMIAHIELDIYTMQLKTAIEVAITILRGTYEEVYLHNSVKAIYEEIPQ